MDKVLIWGDREAVYHQLVDETGTVITSQWEAD